MANSADPDLLASSAGLGLILHIYWVVVMQLTEMMVSMAASIF